MTPVQVLQNVAEDFGDVWPNECAVFAMTKTDVHVVIVSDGIDLDHACAIALANETDDVNVYVRLSDGGLR